MLNQAVHRTESNWSEDVARIRTVRQPFVKRLRQLLQVNGMTTFPGLVSEQRMRANIDARSYLTYPLLFYTLFPKLSLTQLRLLSLSGTYLFDYVLCLDRLLDNPDAGDAGSVFLCQLLHQESINSLYKLFPPEHLFWTYYNQYHEHFIQAVLQERSRHHYMVTPYTEAELHFIYSGKPAVGKVCLAAMALLGNREELITLLVKSHDAFHVGYQLFDDLQDWHLDYQRQHYSYPLTYAFLEADWLSELHSGRRPTLEAVGNLFVQRKIPEKMRALALTYLDMAADCLDEVKKITQNDLDQGSWLAAITQTRQRVEAFEFKPEPTTPVQFPNRTNTELAWQNINLNDIVVSPITDHWLPWLDRQKQPLIANSTIRQVQAAYLQQCECAKTLGLAICQVGLAILHSQNRCPGKSLSCYLGLSTAELDWCHHNRGWLKAVLATSWQEPACLGSPELPAEPFSVTGWVPVGVGRYLGYYLVEEYKNHTEYLLADIEPVKVLTYYYYLLMN